MTKLYFALINKFSRSSVIYLLYNIKKISSPTPFSTSLLQRKAISLYCKRYINTHSSWTCHTSVAVQMFQDDAKKRSSFPSEKVQYRFVTFFLPSCVIFPFGKTVYAGWPKKHKKLLATYIKGTEKDKTEIWVEKVGKKTNCAQSKVYF